MKKSLLLLGVIAALAVGAPAHDIRLTRAAEPTI